MEKDNDNNGKKKIPFLEQVKLFAETMDERFIHSGNGNSGKSLLIFALDANCGNDKVLHFDVAYGDDFDLSYSIMEALNNRDISDLFEQSTLIRKIGVKRGLFNG